jgi:hypothetical protein
VSIIETYTNEYGEKWWFIYDTNKNMGILQGDDFLIEGKTFYVFDGVCPELILDKSEKEWLKTVWEKYSKLRRS